MTQSISDRTQSKIVDVTTDSNSINRLATSSDIVSLTAILNGQKTITVTGSAEILSSISVPVKGVTIKALPDNTGIIYVGDLSVSSATGFHLEAGEAISLDITNLNLIYLDTDTDGDGVSYIGVV